MSRPPSGESDPGKASRDKPGAGRSGSGKPSSGKPGSAKELAGRPPGQRQLRVAEEIRHVLSAVFLRAEFRDPELVGAQVTVTEVRISPDLKNATAFVARLGRTDIDALLPALRRAAAFLRGQVAHEMRLRVAPMLSFQPDTTLDYAMRMDALMRTPEVARDLGAPHEPGASDDA